MRSPFLLIVFCSLMLLFSAHQARSQGALCPPNLDFEDGTFANWECKTGKVQRVGFNHVFTWTGFSEEFNRHTIIPPSNNLLDDYGFFPQRCPNGSGYSVRLGNAAPGAEAEAISYTYTIPSTVTSFSIIYYYAIVLQNPNHSAPEQPRFAARILDVATNTELNCVSFDFPATSSLPGFQVSPVDPEVIYKDWTPITIDLGSYAGRTIRIEFVTNDCTLGGHFGYVYVDVDARCSGAISGATICEGDTALELKAPFGFQSYAWYEDNTFSNMLSTTQNLILRPVPAVGTTYPVIVTPYPGYGCQDTLYAVVTASPRPLSNAGNNQMICKGQAAQLGAPPNAGMSYLWSPDWMLSNPASANPQTIVNPGVPVEFTVKTTDLRTGCFSYDTVVVDFRAVDTALRISGAQSWCIGSSAGTTLSVNSSAVVQWYLDDLPIPGATSSTYQPTGPGSYWAILQQNSCIDSTRKIVFNVSSVPVADFSMLRDTQCVNAQFQLTNNSSITPTEPLNYFWKFGNGNTSIVDEPTISFDAPGNYTIRLIASSPTGCVDSIDKIVRVFPNAIPDFKWDSICTNRPVQFTNLTNTNGASVVNYTWDFGNSTGSTLFTPAPVVYDTKGTYSISLEVETPGCEFSKKRIVKTVNVNESVPGIRYRDLTKPQNTVEYIKARDNIGTSYNWTPSTQLSNPVVKNPLFTATNDVKYTIEITDGNGCLTVDTLQMLVLKKPGYYLATAFTPNGDGLNDRITPYLIGMKSLKKFTIFNRYGNVVFTTSKEGEGWDGNYRGLKLDSGVFVWILEFVTNDDKVVVEKGNLTLIR